MAYQSRYSGAQIDTAIDLIYSAVNQEGAWHNMVVPFAEDTWSEVTEPQLKEEYGVYGAVIPYTAFSETNQYPLVYFVESNTNSVWSLPAKYMRDSNPKSILVFSNVRIAGTLIISSGSGHTTNTNE